MRTLLIILGIVIAAVVAVIVYLFATTPHEAPPLRAPLTASQQELVARVPTDAEAYALIAAPAILLRKLEANPVTMEAIANWRDQQALPPRVMLGAADAIVWKRGKSMSYAVRFDPVRAFIVRIWTMFSAIDSQWDGHTLLIGEQRPAGFSPPAEMLMASGLPDGDVFVVQRQESRGAFPPIPRPAITSVKVDNKVIEMTSRAASRESGGGLKPALHSVSASAMLAVAFTDPPRVLGDVDRLVATDVEALVRGGATIAVYKVDTGTLLPRPFMAIAVPAEEQRRATVEKYRPAIEMVGETMEQGGELVVAFDRTSAGQYSEDVRRPVPWPANRWALRIDPEQLIPVLKTVGDSTALRFATPRIHRGARDLRRWMGSLEQADSIEAAASTTGGFEELRVRVASK